MSHPINEELLSAYLDHELSPADRAEVDRQLAASSALREQLAELAEACQQVRMLTRPYAPPELRATVMDRIDQGLVSLKSSKANAARRGWTRPSRWGAVAAVAALLLVGRWSLLQTDNTVQEVPALRSLAVAPVATPSPAPRVPMVRQGFSKQMANGREFGFQLKSRGAKLVVAGPPVPVVSLSEEEIRQRIASLETMPNRGNSLQVPASLQSNAGETPIVVVFTVVDVRETMNQMQVLLKREGIRSPENPLLSEGQTVGDDSQLKVVTLQLEMPGPEMVAVLNGVSAFDAVMYVPEEVPALAQSAAPAETGSKPALKSESARDLERERNQGREPVLENARRMADAVTPSGHPQRFDFQELAAASNLTRNTESEAIGGNSVLPVAREPAAPAAAPAGASDAAKPAVVSNAESGKPVELKSLPEPAIAQADAAGAGVRNSETLAQEWRKTAEQTRKYRALILLKQQTPGSTVPVE